MVTAIASRLVAKPRRRREVRVVMGFFLLVK
jgi:hypothetical protein